MLLDSEAEDYAVSMDYELDLKDLELLVLLTEERYNSPNEENKLKIQRTLEKLHKQLEQARADYSVNKEYLIRGYSNRFSYLAGLAEMYELTYEQVHSIASAMGVESDFSDLPKEIEAISGEK